MSLNAADIAALFDSDMPGYVSAVVGGVSVGALLRTGMADAFGVVTGNETSLLVSSGFTVAVGAAVVIPSGSYKVVDVRPETAFRKRLILRKPTA